MTKKLLGVVFVIFLSVSFLHAQENDSLEMVYFEMGEKYLDNGNYHIAIAYFDSVIVINTENTDAYAFRGLSKFSLKQYNEAIEDFDLAIILAPGYAEVYFYRGLSKLEIDANKKACEDLYMAYDQGYKKAMKIIKNVCEEEKKTKSK